MADIIVEPTENIITPEITAVDVAAQPLQNVISVQSTVVDVAAQTTSIDVIATSTVVEVVPTVVQNVIVAGVPTGGGGGGNDSSRVPMSNGWPTTITLGQVVYASNTDDVVRLAQADGEPQCQAIGVVAETAIPNGQLGMIQTGGVIGGLTGLTAGAKYYLSPTLAGGITAIPPTTPGQSLVEIGTALSATELLIRCRLVVAL